MGRLAVFGLLLGLWLGCASDDAGGPWGPGAPGGPGSGTTGSPPAGAGSGAPASGGCQSPCMPPFGILFASEQLPSFYLTIPDDNGPPSSYGQLSRCTENGLAEDPPAPECDYQPGAFHAVYDPAPLDGVDARVQSEELPVGIRLKGRASFRSIEDKPAFKVKFTEADGQRLLGLSRLTLNNMVQDPSSLRERMAYRVYRDLGVPAPLANSARVYVRRKGTDDYEYYGLYANVQTLDRRFVEYRFGEVAGQAGNLFDTKNSHYFTDFDRSQRRDQAGTEPGAQEERFQLETNTLAPDTSDLTAAIDAVYVEDIGATAGLAQLSGVLDVEEWIRIAAAQAMLADWDGFAGARNNYKTYHDLVAGKFVILPWGTDQTFGARQGNYRPNWHYPLDHEESERGRSLFLLRCLEDSGCRARYDATLSVLAMSFDTQGLLAELDRVAAQIEAAVREDERRPHSDEDFQEQVQYVRHFIEHRAACVSRLLDGQPCQELTEP